MILECLDTPIVLAPLAGGPSTPELAAAVSNAGGLGFLAGGYLTAEELGRRIEAARSLGVRQIAVNLFCPGRRTEPSVYGAYFERLRVWAEHAGAEIGQPRYTDDQWEQKLALVRENPPAVVSFTFGCPPRELIQTLQAAGSEAWVTVTSSEEARTAQAAGADVLVVQGAEAGGHRASFVDDGRLALYGLLPLLGLVRAATGLPIVASGGLATSDSVAAVLRAGAAAAQIGTAFLLAPEAGTSEAHRAALPTSRRTVLTRAFTGRLARGIANDFIAEHESHAPPAYPEIHFLTAPMRARARREGDAQRINLWAGEAHELALPLPAAEVVRHLTPV